MLLEDCLAEARLSHGVGCFESTARVLLEDFLLRVRQPSEKVGVHRLFRLREIEFYLHSPSHPDPFTHQRSTQEDTGMWYFHRAGRDGASYRGGSFKGLDITFGGDCAHGGILLRSIEALDDDNFRVNGPSLVVDTILEHCCAPSIARLVEEMPSLRCSDTDSPLCLVERGSRSPPSELGQLLSTPRVGLSLKTHGDHARSPLSFIMRRYRFLKEPRRSKHMHLAALELYRRGNTTTQIAEELAVQSTALTRWTRAFDSGSQSAAKNQHYADRFLGRALDVDATCRLFGALS